MEKPFKTNTYQVIYEKNVDGQKKWFTYRMPEVCIDINKAMYYLSKVKVDGAIITDAKIKTIVQDVKKQGDYYVLAS